MTEADIRMARFLSSAYSSVCGVAQDIKTRAVIVLPATSSSSQVFDDVRAASSWLRVYATCGTQGRRCFLSGCSCHSSVAVYGDVPASVLSSR
jgi:hypothetical protein